MKSKILSMAKEVRETADENEAAAMLQSGLWVAVEAAYQGAKIVWVLIRIA